MAGSSISRVFACVALSLLATAARADWLEVSSDHFVIYADQSEKELRRFAERLERFHAAMAILFKLEEQKPSPSNRVTIYVVANQTKVRKLADSNNRYLAGFYKPRAGGTVAVVPKLDRSSYTFELSSESILYHEYAHHFLYGLTARVFPRWFVEGYAEFFASARFKPDGSVGLGAPALHRAPELVHARGVPIRRLLEFDGGADPSKTSYDSFYGQSWLLFHYLMFEPARSGQLVQYEKLLSAGKPALEAATSAFGDLDRLEKDLDRYQERREMSYLSVGSKAIKIGAISVRTLRPGETAMMPMRIQSRLGVDSDEAQALLPEARRVAALHADDPAVLASLAAAEYDAGDDDAAIAAADAALAINPSEIDAHIQKGYALYSKAKRDGAPKEAWQEARSQFVRANKVENDHPIPLFWYYLTFAVQGETPTKNAVAGLEWAMELAPFDPTLRWAVAQQMIADQRLEDAARTLAPLAYSPHPGEHTGQALALLKEVEARLASTQEPVGD
jgi:tetratricopeptide (TPR) repeat protein